MKRRNGVGFWASLIVGGDGSGGRYSQGGG